MVTYFISIFCKAVYLTANWHVSIQNDSYYSELKLIRPLVNIDYF